MYGKKHKPETIEKQRKAKLGKKMPQETKDKQSKRMSGSSNPMYDVHLVMSQEQKDKISKSEKGENHYNWQGGISFLPYCSKFNKSLKEIIRIRDSQICQLCNKTKEQNKEELTVHHIHYDKSNCYPDLICLCRKCNSKVNFNRDYYEELFTFMLWIRNMLYWRIEEIK